MNLERKQDVTKGVVNDTYTTSIITLPSFLLALFHTIECLNNERETVGERKRVANRQKQTKRETETEKE